MLPHGELVEGHDVVVRGERILAVVERGHHGLDPSRLVEAPGATLLPGLIDSHVHLTFSGDSGAVDNLLRDSVPAQLARAAGNAQRALARGVTTAIDCGGRTEVVIALRDGLAEGHLRGPRLLVSGSPLTTTAGHCHWLGGTADSADDLVRAMRLQVAAGVDLIKVMVTGGNITKGSNPLALQFPPESIAALARECARLGKPLVTHAHTAEAVELSAAVGARVIAHATCSVGDGAIVLSDETLEALVAGGSYVDPTLMVAHLAVGADTDPSERRVEQRRAMLPLLRTMNRSGVPLLAGTDAGVPGVPHGSVSGSMVALHREVGLSVGDALLAGTRNAASAFRIDDEVGSIEPDLVADLLLVDGLVDVDFEAIERPLAVWQAGVLVASSGLVSYLSPAV
jgi:imidazolonepropionase-like amidohydrolase